MLVGDAFSANRAGIRAYLSGITVAAQRRNLTGFPRSFTPVTTTRALSILLGYQGTRGSFNVGTTERGGGSWLRLRLARCFCCELVFEAGQLSLFLKVDREEVVEAIDLAIEAFDAHGGIGALGLATERDDLAVDYRKA